MHIMCLRHCVYHNTFLNLLPSMYYFTSDFIKKVIFCIIIVYVYLSSPHHVNEFSTILTAYDTTLILCFRKMYFI